MIEFKRITINDKDKFEQYLFDGNERGCEYTFANLYMWGRQCAAIVEDHLVLFSQYDRRSVYPFPVGTGDKKTVLDAIIHDSQMRGITCRFTGLTSREREILEELYPGMFHFQCDRGFSDYVYDINDLADLKGRRFHSKRNHYNKFCQTYPDYEVSEINNDNIGKVIDMVSDWYRDKEAEDTETDFDIEKTAIKKAFADYDELGMDGLVIIESGNIIAMTMGSLTSETTIDVHFEKAKKGINGAYSAINCEFAKFIRRKYPNIKYLNREEDMGIPGLRKAKESYRPHHMVEKCWARKLED